MRYKVNKCLKILEWHSQMWKKAYDFSVIFLVVLFTCLKKRVQLLCSVVAVRFKCQIWSVYIFFSAFALVALFTVPKTKTLQPINIRTLSYYSHHASFMAFHLYTSTLSLSLSLEQQQQQQ